MFWITVAMLATLGGAFAQQTAQANVPPELRECYTNPLLMDRNNLPPATIQVLIDLIQKIEDSPNVNMDLRVLSAVLLHEFRQDGIEYHAQEVGAGFSSVVLPFAPTFHSFYRHRLLLTKLVPSNLQALSNNTLSTPLRCAIHHMLSTTVDARLRGDENACGQLSQLRALRTSRDTRRMEETEDVEIFSPQLVDTEYGQMRQFEQNDDVEFTNSNSHVRFERQLGDSSCPILTGAVNTRWGAVSAGSLIAGIAAGAQLQQVSLSELTKGTVQAVNNAQQTVLNLYPATLSGDLAEAVLIQGARGRNSIAIGMGGNWNSTQATKYFMLANRNNVEMTDPEIRGGLDGFILGSRMTNILQTFGTLKLSQLLDMYYTQKNGVFDTAVRACNRRTLSAAVFDNALTTQTESFSLALNANMPLPGTITNGLTELVNSAITNLQTYTQNNFNDLSCENSETIGDSRLRTNLYIALDASYPYQTVYPAISYLLDAIEVGKFGSSVTLLNAFDGSVIINQTFSQSDFHTEYTQIRHQTITQGVNLETAFSNIRTIMQDRVLNETASNYVGGNSTVLLFLLNNGNIVNNPAVFAHARIINSTIPDLRVLFVTSTNQLENLSDLVRDMHSDIHQVYLSSTGANVASLLAPVLQSIERVPRRVINPLCGIAFTAGSSGTRQFDDFVEPNFINFYSVSSNYFYGNNENTRLRISRATAGVGSLVVCYSRTIVQPRRNGTILGVGDDSLVTCEDLSTSGNVEINLRGACDSYADVGTCPPLYISVQAVSSATTFTAACTTILCRFPYDNRFTVQADNLQCYSGGATSIVASLIIIVSALVMHLFRLQ